MDPLTLLLLGVVVALAVVVSMQFRARRVLVEQLETTRTRALDQSTTNARQLEEARSAADTRADESLLAQTNDLRAKLERAENKTRDLEEEVERARGRAQQLEEELAQIRERSKQLENKGEAADPRLRELERQIEVVQGQTTALRQERDEARARAETYRKDLETFRGQTKALQTNVDEAQRAVKKYRDELEGARRAVERLEAESLGQRGEIADVRALLERERLTAMADVGAGQRQIETLQVEVQTQFATSEAVTKELAEERAKADTRIRELMQAMRRAEEDVSTAQMQKDSFAGEVRALRDELERRKRLAEAEGKGPAVSKVRPSKPPEPITTYFCLVCGEGGAGPKPHRCMVEEAEQRKKLADKR